MIDAFLAIIGKRTCGWCRYKDENIIERWAGGFDRSRLQRLVWWIYLRAGLGLWRVGEYWHHRHHHEPDAA